MGLLPYSYELSEEADKDLQEIYDYTSETFGDDQAIKYLTGLEELFYILCKQPQTGRARTEVKKGLRSISYTSHVVFYHVAEHRVIIVRVLHASRDIPKFL